MEKLTIKELAPYLPYELQWVFEGSDDVHEVVGLDITDFGVHIISPYGDSGRCSIKEGKPLLIPLSQLTEEIEHNGERFVSMEALSEWTMSKEEFEYIVDWLLNKGVDNIPYWVVEKLHEWHFDVFGLIDRGIALPIDRREAKL